MAGFLYPTLRFYGVLKKEFIEIKRDYITYLSLMLIPFAQLILFGYIINTDAHHLPTVIISYDSSPLANSLVQGFKNTDYFAVTGIKYDQQQAEKLLHSGKIQFVINIPSEFSRDLIRKRQPHILVEGDGTDPVAVTNAFAAARVLGNNILNRDLTGPLNYLNTKQPSFVVDTHAKYNPALLAQYHTLPGLIASLLTISLIMLTAISIASEYERGTIESLLTTPLKPLEVILGKIIPHLLLGYTLFSAALIITYYLFRVPFYGSILLLTLTALPFFIANLGIGLAVSTTSRTQFQAANLANTYILPAVLLSGFMFPFYAMPVWAQWIGELMPITHYIRIIIGVMLKGAGLTDIWPDLWPILLFMVIVLFISLRYYRKTLD